MAELLKNCSLDQAFASASPWWTIRWTECRCPQYNIKREVTIPEHGK